MNKNTISAKRTPNPKALELFSAYYVVAVGYSPEDGTEYASNDGRTVYHQNKAKTFDTYSAAIKWMVANCEIEDTDNITRGHERPDFPRVKFLREYVELTDC
jgi:hypothetical protein